MKELIDVFRIYELPSKVRINIILKLGRAINNNYGMNITEELVYELVKTLDPKHPILDDEHYLRHVK